MPPESIAIDSEQAPRRSAKQRFIAAARWVLLLLVVAAAVWQFATNWSSVVHTIAALQWHRVVLSFIAVIAGIGFSTLSWQALVDDLGKPIGVGRGAQIFLVGQLGKYLPGSVWAYVLQIELGRRAGLARARVFAGTMFSLAVILVAALIAGALAVPALIRNEPSLSWLPWLYVLLPVALVMLHPKILTALVRIGFRVLRRPQPDHDIRLVVVLRALALALLSYISYGVHLWLLADDFKGLTFDPLLLCIGTMGAAMMAGLVAFFLPSGIGARETVIVAALTGLVGGPQAFAFAAVSRVLFIAADLVTAGGAALLAVVARRRQGDYHGDPGIE
ncbi:lysylphosphatidylglycerol synthase domain-containing protein [Schumannella soli]|uniref:Flippase-like domain-containing protein n=1 Tax=Schumannella soli TaxID=2590779 RepID=A0A506Y6G7_9MICO|nr:lysylphosphatidylglycerol synthase domain-containing protein [Schumannella soli]TPW75989.1 flippase-like domain-containing protein [Schumannella soli]